MKNALIVLVVIVALGMGFIAQRLMSTPVSASENQQTETLPEFSLPDLSGQQHSIREWQGKILIINFWATWCPPCLKEIPEFIKLQQEHQKDDLQFIGIAIDEATSVKAFIDANNINYPVLIGEDNGIELAQQLGNIINALPFTIVIDKNGRIIHRHPGEFSREQVLEIITPEL